MIQKREVYYFKIAEAWAGKTFDIGDGYGILKVYEEDIKEVISMTGYYFFNEDGEKENTDDQFWNMEEIKQKKFYFQDNDKEIDWDGAYVDLFYEYWDGNNWKKIWLDNAGMNSDNVEDVTDEIGMLKRIGVNREQTYNEYAYVSSNGKYYYKYSSLFVGSLDFLEETDLETLEKMFEEIDLDSIEN